jgi:segregation and condensation protein A
MDELSSSHEQHQKDRAEGTGLPVHLDVFEGPLDLLLYLVQKNKVSVYDIPIATICEQFHDHLRQMQELDIEIASEFLRMAAWLVHLKSRLVLPRERTEAEEERSELVERLLAYRRVRELASHLYSVDVVRRCIWPVAIEPRVAEAGEATEIDWENVDLRLLAGTYIQVLERFHAANPPPLRVPPLRFTVETTMRALYDRIAVEPVFPLLRHLHTRSDPEEIVTLVVAALELGRLGCVVSEQHRPFAEIFLRRGERELGEALAAQRALTSETDTGPTADAASAS